MEAIIEKQCLEEISSLVLDASEKVTLKTISNNWMITNEQAQDVLSKWIEKNIKTSKEGFVKEFLVRGTNTKGILSFSIVDEEKRNKLEKLWKGFSSWIYSIEATKNTRKLNIPDLNEIKVKNILLSKSTNLRDIHVPVFPTATVAEVKKQPEPQKSKTPAFFKPQPKKASPEKKKTPEKVVEVKTEKLSPPQENSQTKPQPKTAKNQKATQKGSISSFFNSKPSTASKPQELSTSKIEEKPKVVKREPSPEVEIVDEPKNKKLKVEPKKLKTKKLANSNKRSRIRVMADSSEEEEENEEEKSEEPETKFIKFDREMTPENESKKSESENDEKPPEKTQESQTRNKRKAKRMVTKRFMTDEGFMRTETVQEEYSASDDDNENDENKKKNSPEISKKSQTKTETKTVEKKSTEKKKNAAKPAQSSKITNFFTRK